MFSTTLIHTNTFLTLLFSSLSFVPPFPPFPPSLLTSLGLSNNLLTKDGQIDEGELSSTYFNNRVKSVYRDDTKREIEILLAALGERGQAIFDALTKVCRGFVCVHVCICDIYTLICIPY